MSQRLYEDLEERKKTMEAQALDGSMCSLGDFRKLRDKDLIGTEFTDAVQRARHDFQRYSQASKITGISVGSDCNNEPVIHFYGTYNNGKADIQPSYRYFADWRKKMNRYSERIRNEYGIPNHAESGDTTYKQILGDAETTRINPFIYQLLEPIAQIAKKL